jgi:glycosyltransferase involved in cell wall biosynthesis
MTDPLGMSQVIPYLAGLARLGHEITLVSFEKPQRFASGRAAVEELLRRSGIDWRPARYHKKPPILSTVWDVLALRLRAGRIARQKRIELVHCRSYVTALVGLWLKRSRGTRFVFDMRGFWADERVDGGLWDVRKPHFGLVYRFFKKMELRFVNGADRTVSLTHAGKAEMRKWRLAPGAAERIDVIPCCADLAHFDRARVPEAERERLRRELGLTERDFVVGYLGSLGTWYLLDEMLAFFKILLAARPEARLLFITPDEPSLVFDAARKAGVDPGALRVRAASRAEVPGLLSLARVGLFFIKPSYSKISSSPTKLAELLAMGIPIVTNSGVGDTDWLASRVDAALVLQDFGAAELRRGVEGLARLEGLAPERIRGAAEEYFSLATGVEAYERIYSTVGRARDCRP